MGEPLKDSIRRGDPRFEEVMEGVHGPTGLTKIGGREGQKPVRKKNPSKGKGGTRFHPIDGSAPMRGIGRYRRYN